MTTVYTDTSALLKRVVIEPESAAVRALLRDRAADGDLLVSSSLAWLEVWRALRRAGLTDIEAVAGWALSGIAAFPFDEVVLLRARRVGKDELRSLDAIHLAAAIAVGADSLLTYDERLARSANVVGLEVLAPVAPT
jgi:predicted nucleic acid-binding protein